MTSEALKDRLNQQSFRGFGLRMPDGRLLPVPHPEFISIDPEEERIAVVWKGNGGYWTVDLELVSDLEPLNHKGTPPLSVVGTIGSELTWRFCDKAAPWRMPIRSLT